MKEMEEALKGSGTEYHVSEMYSPPRVTSMAGEVGLVKGMALDLTTVDELGNVWDFDKRHL